MSSDLHDVLRDMAEDRQPQRREDEGDDAPPPDALPEAEDAHPLEALEAQQLDAPATDASPIDDESGETLGYATAASPSRSPGAAQANRALHAAAVPVLITVGMLLILLGAWGTAVLRESEIMLSDRPDAPTMARAMVLIGYPLGVCLLASAGYFIHRLRRSR